MATPPPAPPPPAPAGAAAPSAAMVLRPLGVGEILDRSIKVYLRHFLTLARIVLVIVVPVQLVSVAITLITTPPQMLGFGSATALDAEGGDLAVYIGGQIVNGVLAVVVLLLTTAACFRAVADAYLGGEPDWRESLRFAAAQALALLWLYVLTIVLLLVAFLALIVPGVWLSIAWLVSTPVLLLERARGFEALRRSQRLVKGRWWPTFGCMLVAAILMMILALFVGIVFGVTAFFTRDAPVAFVAVNAVTSALSSVVSTPLTAAIVSLIYFDLRVRKEGLDLQLLAQRIGAPGPSADAPAYSPPALAVAAALLAASPAHGAGAASAEVRALAAQADRDPAALRRLRSIDRVDGRRVDLGAALEGADPAELRDRLRTLTSTGGAAGAAPRPAAARQRAQGILGQRRYRASRFPRPLQSVFREIGEAADWVARRLAERVPGGGRGLGFAFGLAVLLAAALVLRSLLRRRTAALAPLPAATPGHEPESDPADLERAADEAERAGEPDRAVRLRFHAGLLRLDRAGAIALTPSLTSGEAARRLRSPELERLAASFDAAAYGGRRPGPAELEHSRTGWARVLAEAGAR